MNLIEAVKGLLGVKGASMDELVGFDVAPDSEGLSFFLRRADFEALQQGAGNELQHVQFVVLRMLEEQGVAERIGNGFRVPSDAVAGLDQDQADLLRLPPRNPGEFIAHISGRSTHSAFRVDLTLRLPDGETRFKIKGPFLELGGGTRYLMNQHEALALDAWQRHCGLPAEERGAPANLRLMAALQTSQRSGMRIDLAHFEALDVLIPEGIGVSAVRMPDGSLQLGPTLGDGSTPEQLQRRWKQLDLDAEGGVLRVQNRVVLLDQQRLAGVKEILGNRRIPPERVAEFLKTPTAFLDGALVNLDLGFSVRVLGIGRLEHMEFGTLDGAQRDWFGQTAAPDVIGQMIQSPEELERVAAQIAAARASGADTVVIDGTPLDISDAEKVDQQLESARKRLGGEADGNNTPSDEPAPGAAKPDTRKTTLILKQAAEIHQELRERAGRARATCEPAWEDLARQPFEHQREGISWMTGLIEAGLQGCGEDLYRLQGALLADDMGLGKTYMTLVAASEYLRRQQAEGKTQKPILVVAPLSLMENWEDEVGHTFKASPFRDIVVLQSGRDLSTYRDGKVERESVQLSSLLDDGDTFDDAAIRYALRIGPEAGARRLDLDRRLVLTTYQTLRDYQFSLCRIDWGLVILDEAQNSKNPNALQTRAAKGLKADFKLLATGTPVENSLGDFWCLMDTAQPGLLGDWATFRDTWIKPIVDADEGSRNEVRKRVGSELREAVGAFMLRRTKEERLKGLPPKNIHSGVSGGDSSGVRHEARLSRVMPSEQLAAYDAVLEDYQRQKSSGDSRGQALAALQKLRQVSLHPAMSDPVRLMTTTSQAARGRMCESGKLAAVLDQLDAIKAANEKVILFMVTKALQRAVKLWLDRIYGLDIDIINGDTEAMPKKSDVLSRKQLIGSFESKTGFNILIMSPIAAGVGLTVVGANHVIHVERHWNPAKEAQATDRVYRIGQTRDVHVYLPAATHPTLNSFDVHLDRLLRGKIVLKDAVMTPDVVEPEEMAGAMGL